MESSLPQSPTLNSDAPSASFDPMRELRAWKRTLRKDFPLPPKTRVYIKIIEEVTVNGCRAFAAYGREGNCVTIWLERNRDVSRMVSDMQHEWVHLLCPGEKQDLEHAEPFGRIMSEMNRWYDHGIRPKCCQFRPSERLK